MTILMTSRTIHVMSNVPSFPAPILLHGQSVVWSDMHGESNEWFEPKPPWCCRKMYFHCVSPCLGFQASGFLRRKLIRVKLLTWICHFFTFPFIWWRMNVLLLVSPEFATHHVHGLHILSVSSHHEKVGAQCICDVKRVLSVYPVSA